MNRWISSSSYMQEEFPFWIAKHTQDSLDAHGHEFVELVYIVQGKGTHFFEGQYYDTQAGDVFIINPGETHAYELESGQTIEIINCLFMPSIISDSLLRELEISKSIDYFYVHPFMSTELRFNHKLNLQGPDAAGVMALLDNMIRELAIRNTGYKTMIRLQLIELLVLLSRFYTNTESHRTPPLRQQERELTARRVYGYLERNYEKRVTLEDLGELFNVSSRQLNRIMNGQYGKSVIDLLHGIRIERAKHLLTDTDEKVISIATMVGYEDPSFFSRLFSRHVGCSPSQYRNR